MEYIIGKYKKNIFKTDTGYNICIFKVEETNIEEIKTKNITITGYFHELNEIDTYKLEGTYEEHIKYGKQFNVKNYQIINPTNKNSTIEFLTSGIFKGIGEKKAKSIVEVLKENTLKIILERPSDLILIPGITKSNIDTLHNTLKEYQKSYKTIVYLTEIGFTSKDSVEIYNKYQIKTKEIIENNIYQIIKDIKNMSFKKIDSIALKNGMNKLSITRLKAAIIYIMNEVSYTYGNTYFFKEELSLYLNRLIKENISIELFKTTIKELIKDLSIINYNNNYYLKELYDAEVLISRRVKILAHEKIKKIKNIDEKLSMIENKININYNEEQKQAIITSVINNISIITGGPGTGKTTIMKGIINLYKEVNKLNTQKLTEELALLAPTGRAAKRLTETTNFPASTIHRFLKWNKEKDTFQINEYNKSKAKFIIIDEASMIDVYLITNLLKGISVNTKILLVGDDEQLPAIGPGNLLYDLINSNKVTTTTLKTLYRQKEESNIIKLAYDIRNSELNTNIFNKKEDLIFIKSTPSNIINHIEEIIKKYKKYIFKNLQILVPIYKGVNGIDNINNYLQKIVNEKNETKLEIEIKDLIIREKDKVIQLTNQPDDNIYNGDIGLVSKIVLKPQKEIYINYDSNIVKYTPSNFSNFRLAYSTSIHKAQGSEFDYIIIPIVKSYNKMLYKKLIYTAVTRAKKKLIIIGDIEALQQAIKNEKETSRRTTLIELLNK